MIEERILAADDLCAVIRDQRERVDRLVAQAERQQDELARLRAENRRLIGLLRESPQPSAGNSSQAIEAPLRPVVDDVAETFAVPHSAAEIARPAATSAADERVRSRPGIASWRTLAAAIVLAVCGISAVTIGHSPADSAQHTMHSVSLIQR